MHDSPRAPDVAAEWQHCQFVRHAQDPRRVPSTTTQKPALWFNLRVSHRLAGGRSRSGVCDAPTKNENKKAGASTAPASAGTILFAASRRSFRYFWMLA
jgi:hypothetical protein